MIIYKLHHKSINRLSNLNQYDKARIKNMKNINMNAEKMFNYYCKS